MIQNTRNGCRTYCVKIPLFYWISIITIAHNHFEQSKLFIKIHWALSEQSSVFSGGLRDVEIYWELHFPWSCKTQSKPPQKPTRQQQKHPLPRTVASLDHFPPDRRLKNTTPQHQKSHTAVCTSSLPTESSTVSQVMSQHEKCADAQTTNLHLK